MENGVVRYRVNPRLYLCISPEEAVNIGITAGEESVEAIILEKGAFMGSLFYASIREMDEQDIMNIPVVERNELLFNSRKEAVRYIMRNNLDGTLALYGVRDIKHVPRETIGEFEHPDFSQGLDELKKFDKAG
ncbi:MAG: hypothetical protein GX554_01565 [Elusimicrobia bacterium]|nr:hypothetical protein [Elusimicrobiota bacterium]